MPTLLGRVQAQNESWLVKLPPKNTRFRGVIFPTSPTALPTSVFVLPRLGLRTRPTEPVAPRDLFRDAWGRTLLVANHDASLDAGDRVSRLYALFQMTGQVSWKRAVTVTNPVTGLLGAPGAPEELGPIWVSIESYTRGDNDAGLRVTTDRLRCITNARLKLGDLVNGQTVKRINPSLGITIAEIE